MHASKRTLCDEHGLVAKGLPRTLVQGSSNFIELGLRVSLHGMAQIRAVLTQTLFGDTVATDDAKQRKMPGFQPLYASLMNLERLRREFPDYDITTLPTLPEGFVDASSYIDAAPSFENAERGLKVYVDYANYADRESGRSQRFCVSRYDEEDEDVVLSTNDWAAVLRFLVA